MALSVSLLGGCWASPAMTVSGPDVQPAGRFPFCASKNHLHFKKENSTHTQQNSNTFCQKRFSWNKNQEMIPQTGHWRLALKPSK